VFDASAALTAVKDLAEGSTGFTIVMGTPENLARRAAGYVSLGSAQTVDRAAGGLIERTVECHLVLGYRVKGAEGTAELDVAAAVDAFTVAFYASDRRLDGAGTSAELDFGLIGGAEYEKIAGQEYRLYPIVVRVKQRQTMGV
jgi:hypothetical protein